MLAWMMARMMARPCARLAWSIVIGLLTVFTTAAALAQTVSWDGDAGGPNVNGNFGDAANWSPDGVPGPTNDVFLQDVTAGDRVVTLNTAAELNSLYLAQATLGPTNTLLIDGGMLTTGGLVPASLYPFVANDPLGFFSAPPISEPGIIIDGVGSQLLLAGNFSFGPTTSIGLARDGVIKVGPDGFSNLVNKGLIQNAINTNGRVIGNVVNDGIFLANAAINQSGALTIDNTFPIQNRIDGIFEIDGGVLINNDFFNEGTVILSKGLVNNPTPPFIDIPAPLWQTNGRLFNEAGGLITASVGLIQATGEVINGNGATIQNTAPGDAGVLGFVTPSFTQLGTINIGANRAVAVVQPIDSQTINNGTINLLGLPLAPANLSAPEVNYINQGLIVAQSGDNEIGPANVPLGVLAPMNSFNNANTVELMPDTRLAIGSPAGGFNLRNNGTMKLGTGSFLQLTAGADLTNFGLIEQRTSSSLRVLAEPNNLPSNRGTIAMSPLSTLHIANLAGGGTTFENHGAILMDDSAIDDLTDGDMLFSALDNFGLIRGTGRIGDAGAQQLVTTNKPGGVITAQDPTMSNQPLAVVHCCIPFDNEGTVNVEVGSRFEFTFLATFFNMGAINMRSLDAISAEFSAPVLSNTSTGVINSNGENDIIETSGFSAQLVLTRSGFVPLFNGGRILVGDHPNQPGLLSLQHTSLLMMNDVQEFWYNEGTVDVRGSGFQWNLGFDNAGFVNADHGSLVVNGENPIFNSGEITLRNSSRLSGAAVFINGFADPNDVEMPLRGTLTVSNESDFFLPMSTFENLGRVIVENNSKVSVSALTNFEGSDVLVTTGSQLNITSNLVVLPFSTVTVSNEKSVIDVQGTAVIRDSVKINNDGLFKAGKLQVEAGGSVFWDPSFGEIRGDVELAERSFFKIDGGSIVEIGGSLTNAQKDSPNWDVDGRLELTGASGAQQLFEVAGFDFGNEQEDLRPGFSDNFNIGDRNHILGTFALNDGASVKLTDLADNGNRGGFGMEIAPGVCTGNPNGAEALYVWNLEIGNNATLDLNGLHLYYRAGNFSLGTGVEFLNGVPKPIPVPEPAAAALLLLACLILGSGRRPSA